MSNRNRQKFKEKKPYKKIHKIIPAVSSKA